MTLQSRHIWSLAVCIGVALLHPGLGWGETVVKLLTPTEGATVAAPSVHVVYTTREPLSVQVELDGSALSAAPRVAPGPEGYVHHLRVPVEVGEHRLRLLNGEDGTVLESVSLNRTRAFPENVSEGEELRSGFHTREGEDACAECHQLPAAEAGQLDTAAEIATGCSTCHPDVGSGEYVHGPVAVGACFTCHDPAYAPARFATRPALETCGSCHVDVVADVLGGTKYAHGPAAAGACMACHSAHGGASAALLRAPSRQLCLGCHGETMPRLVEGGLHGKLQCTECHAPHGGATPVLTATAGNGFCTGCHPALDPVEPGHPLMGHPVTTAEGFGAEGTPIRCESCHRPHATGDISQLDIVNNVGVQRRFCTGCHS